MKTKRKAVFLRVDEPTYYQMKIQKGFLSMNAYINLLIEKDINGKEND